MIHTKESGSRSDSSFLLLLQKMFVKSVSRKESSGSAFLSIILPFLNSGISFFCTWARIAALRGSPRELPRIFTDSSRFNKRKMVNKGNDILFIGLI